MWQTIPFVSGCALKITEIISPVEENGFNSIKVGNILYAVLNITDYLELKTDYVPGITVFKRNFLNDISYKVGTISIEKFLNILKSFKYEKIQHS